MPCLFYKVYGIIVEKNVEVLMGGYAMSKLNVDQKTIKDLLQDKK